MWDLETSGLDADYGFMLCASWKAVKVETSIGCVCHGDFRVHTISIRDDEKRYARSRTDDRYVAKAISKVLMTADIHVTYNGKRFDWKYVQTRRFIHGWDLLPRIPHVDLLYTAKSVFRSRSKSLKHISTLDRTATVHKSPVDGPTWMEAVAGSARALRYVEKHCRADVLVLEHEYMRLRPAVWQHPRLNSNVGACRYCGSLKVQRRGYEVTALRNVKQRVKCQSCGSWDSLVGTRSKP